MERERTKRGQGLVEMVIILPVLLILMVGVAEIGFGLRNYLLVTNASRESARFAARGRYNDVRVAERVVSAGGIVRLGGSEVPFLRTSGTEPNTGIIVTHLRITPEVDTLSEISQTVYYTGVVPNEAGSVSEIRGDDTKLSVDGIKQRHLDETQAINDIRDAAEYEEMDNHIVLVEVFFAHQPLMLSSLVPIPDPWPMYARTMMRITRGR